MTQLSDRPRRRLISEAPALLPRPRLIASHYRRLASLKQCEMERGDVLIIGCPESKNTPLRSMLMAKVRRSPWAENSSTPDCHRFPQPQCS